MLMLPTAPVMNGRSPRDMERALAAIHQANGGELVALIVYAASEGRFGLFIRFANATDELVTGPFSANYPNCSLTTVERLDTAPLECESWYGDLELNPEIFPILRHA